ncbi:alpha/beta fold hydrolase [Kribbella sp. CA-294648]|uniref:alpha/beta fold hydrolase n=1 Tax=Kribbella sp. CA-294648 TaxID=3239948 RepID=UPI003D8ADE51
MAQQFGEEKVFFLGHSHGGFVGLQFALDYPDRVRGIIVYDGMAFNGQEFGGARQLHDGIAGSELVVLAGSGHFGHLEEPGEFFGSVLRFATAH